MLHSHGYTTPTHAHLNAAKKRKENNREKGWSAAAHHAKAWCLAPNSNRRKRRGKDCTPRLAASSQDNDLLMHVLTQDQSRSAASKAWLAQPKKNAWSLVSTKLAAEDNAQICQISTAFLQWRHVSQASTTNDSFSRWLAGGLLLQSMLTFAPRHKKGHWAFGRSSSSYSSWRKSRA